MDDWIFKLTGRTDQLPILDVNEPEVNTLPGTSPENVTSGEIFQQKKIKISPTTESKKILNL